MVELWDGGGGLPYLGSPTSYNAGDWENALRTYHDSGVYEQQIAKVDAVADALAPAQRPARRQALQAQAQERPPGCEDRPGTRSRGARPRPPQAGDRVRHRRDLALQLHGDRRRQLHLRHELPGTRRSTRSATAIAPSLALFKLAQSRGIATFFITGRRENVRDHTAHNLAREGFTDYTELVLKPDDFTGATVDYKAGARQRIEAQGYRIVASVGDQYSDLAGGHEDVAFKLAEPVLLPAVTSPPAPAPASPGAGGGHRRLTAPRRVGSAGRDAGVGLCFAGGVGSVDAVPWSTTGRRCVSGESLSAGARHCARLHPELHHRYGHAPCGARGGQRRPVCRARHVVGRGRPDAGGNTAVRLRAVVPHGSRVLVVALDAGCGPRRPRRRPRRLVLSR